MTEIPIILIAYFILMTGIGIHSFFKAKTISDFYIAGKKGSWWQITGSLFATIIGGSALMGTVELAQKAGWAAIWFLGSAAAGLLILAFIAPRVRQLGRFTLPEMIRQFYGHKADRAASLMIPAAWLGIIAVQIIAGGRILSSLDLMTYRQGALVCGAIFILYTLLGGQKSILRTDFVQAMIILGVLITLNLLKTHSNSGGAPAAQLPFSLFNNHFTWLDLLMLMLTYSVTFVVGPDIYSRIFCAKNGKTARISVILTAILVIAVAFLLTSLGVVNPAEGGADPGKMLFPGEAFFPPWVIGILAVMLLSAVMSSADTTLLTTSMILSGLITGDLDQKKSVYLTRLFIVFNGLLALLLAWHLSSVLSALLLSLAFFSGAFVLPVLAGILRWKVNKERAFAAMIAGGLTALTGKVIQEFLHLDWGYGLIIAAYLVNAILLFSPGRNKQLPENTDN